MKAESLVMEEVSHSFGSVRVIHKLNMTVQQDEFVAVVGPSGCGKTTLLNLLAGFVQPSSGNIVRSCATRMVYQQDGLFPWLTIEQNIGLGLRHLKEKSQRDEAISHLMGLIQLAGFGKNYPHQLSGGMRQRVQLARALANDAATLLMDEPFSSLDYQTRLRMRGELVRILEIKPRAVVFVTHDIEEAIQLADRILVLTERPALIKDEVAVKLRRPRETSHPIVINASRRILSHLGLRNGNSEPRDTDNNSIQALVESSERSEVYDAV